MKEFINAMGKAWKEERSESQLTLGELVDQLREAFPDSLVANIVFPHSYRGYYCDLAFELRGGSRTAKELLDDCLEALGSEFTGYKGGEYLMDRSTPLWVSNYGSTGLKLLALKSDGTIETAEDD